MRCVLALLLAVPFAAAEEPKSWRGELVLPKKRAKEITFGNRLKDDTKVKYVYTGRMPITVRDHNGDWLRIHDGHNEGWTPQEEWVLSIDAPAYFNEQVKRDPKDDYALFMRGNGWDDKGEYDNALKDFDECIRLEPGIAGYYCTRGVVWAHKKEYDKAIKDYDEAIRLDPKDALAFNNRGNVWLNKKEYDKAIKDYDEAIRLDPKDALAISNRSVSLSIVRKPAVAGFQQVLELQGNKGEYAVYAVILGHFAARQEKDEKAAAKFLKDSAGKLDEAWPYPAVQFLRGDLDEPALLKLADTNDKETEARCFLGLDHLLKGNKDKAAAHFRWVKEKGNPTFTEYTIAVAELDRLEKAK
jgi:lipoprotein NlpI